MNVVDYMERPEEIAKHSALSRATGQLDTGAGARPFIEAMAAGDNDLFDAMWAIWNFEHAWDDLLDETDIDHETKLVAMNELHDSIVAALEQTEDGSQFAGIWVSLGRRMLWTEETAVLAEAARVNFFDVLRTNRFIQGNRESMRAMLVMCLLRCLAGDVMAQSGDPRRVSLAPAVSCADTDLFFHMVYLARGFVAASVWSEQRDYDVPDAVLQKGGI